METSQQLLQLVFADHIVKELADDVGLGHKSLLKWQETSDPEAVSGLERTGRLVAALEKKYDDRLIQHLCARGKGYFVRNAPPKGVQLELWPEYLLLEKHFFATHQTLLDAVREGQISKEKEAAIRRRWQALASEVEGFFAACARGSFRCWAFSYSLLDRCLAGELPLAA
jgi:hypothetical protein